MTFNPLSNVPQGSFAAKVEAARKAREEADAVALSRTDQMAEAAKEFSFAPPELASEALGLVFDNSSSMIGQAIIDAREGTEELMRACTPNETAIKLIPLNNQDNNRTRIQSHFTCDLPSLALDLPNVHAEGGTPLYERIQENLEPDPLNPKVRITRMVIFSDGEPNDYNPYRDEEAPKPKLDITIEAAKAKKVILDTVLIVDNPSQANESNKAYRIMKRLADETGGYFMVFERGKSTFVKGLKYLTKGNRMLLADNEFKQALEAGKVG